MPDTWSVVLSKEDIDTCWAAARTAATAVTRSEDPPPTVADAFRKNLFQLADVRRAIAAGEAIIPVPSFWERFADPEDGKLRGAYAVARPDGSFEVRQDEPHVPLPKLNLFDLGDG